MKIGGVEMMTLVEAGEHSGLSPVTLRIQVRKGVLPGVLVGKTYLVTQEDVDRYVAERKGKHGFAAESHPMHGLQGPGHRRKKMNDE